MLNLSELPANLPIPQDDGECHHLIHQKIPDITLEATTGEKIQIGQLMKWLVIYCYPMTGQPDKVLPQGWNDIPGARGCTPQACAFRDHDHQFRKLGVTVFGLSRQTTAYQKEAVTRLHLPFSLLSDEQCAFTDELNLPTFTVGGMRLNKRVTLLAHDGVIQHYIYPVFPPNQNADQVIAWLEQHV